MPAKSTSLRPPVVLRLFLKSFLLSSALLSWARDAAALTVPADCDYLVITDSLLLPEARRLATFRDTSAADLVKKSHVATMADIYEDYPTHGPKSRAISLFLRDVNGKNGKLPAHLLLFGDASIDETLPDNRVPALYYTVRSPVSTSWNIPEYDTLASDDAYAELLDTVPTDSIRPKTAVGGIPAGSVSQARIYVSKVIAYETLYGAGPGAFTYGFINDDDIQVGNQDDMDPIEIMPELHEKVWNALPVKPMVRRVLSIEFPLQPDNSKPAARDSLIRMLASGPGRFYFMGHASRSQLTDEKIFVLPGDMSHLQPRRRQPIALMLTTMVADYTRPESPSIGEEWLFHPNGVIACLGPVSYAYPITNNRIFAKWDEEASKGGTLGASFSRTKAGVDPKIIAPVLVFTLLGDPALTLRVPAFDLAPATGSGQSRLVLQAAGSQGDSAYVQLVQVDSVLYDPFIHPGNIDQKGRKYLRESVLGEAYSTLGAGGNISLDLPPAPVPQAAAVKVMTWSPDGKMRYGHFPLSDLGPLGVRGACARKAAMAPYRLVLDGTSVRVLWNGSSRSGEKTVPVRSFDLKGAIRR